jgi:hypothetical protein
MDGATERRQVVVTQVAEEAVGLGEEDRWQRHLPILGHTQAPDV